MNTKFSWRSRRYHTRVISKICCVILLLVTINGVNAAAVEDFMPKESFLYVKLQDIDEVYGEIEISENWEKALALFSDVSNWQEMQQGLVMLQGMLGTNLQGVIETVGYRTALAVWLAEANDRQMGVVIHSGGNLAKLQQMTKIVEGLLGMNAANTLHVDAGVYQRVRYNALEIDSETAKYGFVDDFLVLGVGEGSFEKLLDVYRTDMPSLQQNPKFDGALEKVGSGEVILFANVSPILSAVGLADWERRNLAAFQSAFGRLNLLETDPLLQLSVEFRADQLENEIGLFLKEGQGLETLNILSGEEDLFVAVAPNVLGGVWEFGLAEMRKNSAEDTFEAIAFLEGLLNLDLEEDLITGLTGELALSVSDLRRFDPEVGNLSFEFDGTFAIDAGDVETDGGIIFYPSHRMKWNQIGNSLSNLHNASVSQTEYKGVTVSEVASNIYYGNIEGLFLAGFSEEEISTLIDGIKRKKRPSYLKQLPETPTAFAQLNVARALEMEKGSLPADKLIVDAKEIPLLLAWLSVENDTALLEVTLSEKETAVEMLAKLVPFLLWNMEVEWE